MAGIEYRHVIVPVDGSDSAGRAARYAANLAYCCEGVLILVHVFPSSPAEVASVYGYPLPASDLQPTEAEIEKAQEQAAKQAFAQARRAIMGGTRKAMDAVGSPVREEVLRGDPAEAIIEYSRQQPESMIVMGSRGLSRMRGLLLGSVSEKVLRHADCPVTVVR